MSNFIAQNSLEDEKRWKYLKFLYPFFVVFVGYFVWSINFYFEEHKYNVILLPLYFGFVVLVPIVYFLTQNTRKAILTFYLLGSAVGFF